MLNLSVRLKNDQNILQHEVWPPDVDKSAGEGYCASCCEVMHFQISNEQTRPHSSHRGRDYLSREFSSVFGQLRRRSTQKKKKRTQTQPVRVCDHVGLKTNMKDDRTAGSWQKSASAISLCTHNEDASETTPTWAVQCAKLGQRHTHRHTLAPYSRGFSVDVVKQHN